jgi:hypothetical protein
MKSKKIYFIIHRVIMIYTSVPELSDTEAESNLSSERLSVLNKVMVLF